MEKFTFNLQLFADNSTIAKNFAEFMLKKTEKGYPALCDTGLFEPDTKGFDPPANAYLTENWTIQSEDNLTLSGVHYAPKNSKGQWVVMVTGYGQVGATMNLPAMAILALDYDVLVIDPRTSGSSEGDWLTMGVAECVDVALWTQKIAEQNANAQITLFGISMGAATVIMAAALSQTTNVTSLIEDCGYANIYTLFDKFATLYAKDYGWTGTNKELYDAVVAYTKSQTGYDVSKAVPADSISNVTVPSLFIHGTDDTLVSVDNVDTLYNASGATEKELWTVEGAGHAKSITEEPVNYLFKAGTLINSANEEIGASINSSASNTTILGTIYDDTISVDGDNVTIEANTGVEDSISNGGNDLISSKGNNNSIKTGDGENTVIGFGNYYTIDGGAGDDYISISGEYFSVDAGEGDNIIKIYSSFNDTIISGSGDDSISVGKGDHLNISSGDGDDTITGTAFGIDDDDWSFGGYATIDAGAGDDYIAPSYSDNSSINAGDGNDTIINNGEKSTLDGGDGNDYIEMTNAATGEYESALINGGAGNDSIYTRGNNTTIDGGAGDDSITAIEADQISINAGDGNNYVFNAFAYYDENNNFIGKNTNPKKSTGATIIGGSGNDSLGNQGIDYAIVDAGDGDNFIGLYHSYYNTVTTGSGNDSVFISKGHNLILSTGAGNDSIIGRTETYEENEWSFGGNATVDAGAGNDYIAPLYTNNSSIYGGAGNDTIITNGKETTIDGGEGNDYIELTNAVTNKYEGVVINASAGEDTIVGYTSASSIVGEFTSSTVDGNDVIFTNGENTVKIIGAKGNIIKLVDSDGNINSTIIGGDGSMAIKELGSNGVYSSGGVRYTSADGAAVELKVDDNGAVTGIISGSVSAVIDGSTKSPEITIDGTTAFDFTATGSTDNGLNIKVGDQSITYVEGSATYTANTITYPAGELKLSTNISSVLGNIKVTIPEGGVKVPTGSKNVTLDLANEVSMSFEGNMITGAIKLSGKITYNGDNKSMTLAKDANITMDNLSMPGLTMNFGLTANAESTIKMSGLNLVIADGANLNVTGTLFGVEGDLSVTGGDLSLNLLGILTGGSGSLTLSNGATLSITPKNFANPILATANGADATNNISFAENQITFTSTDDNGISLKIGNNNNFGTTKLKGTVVLDTANKKVTFKEGAVVDFITPSGVKIHGNAKKDTVVDVSKETSSSGLLQGTNSDSSSWKFTFDEDNDFEITLINEDGEALIGGATIKFSGTIAFNSDSSITLDKDAKITYTFSDGYKTVITNVAESGGNLLITETGFQYTPEEGNGKLQIAVTKDGVTRTSTLDATGTFTYSYNGTVLFDEESTIKLTAETGNVMTINAKKASEGTIIFEAEDGLTISATSENDLTASYADENGNTIYEIKSVTGTLKYSGGVLTISDGTELNMVDYDNEEYKATVSGGNVTVEFIENGDKARYITGDNTTVTVEWKSDGAIWKAGGNTTFTDNVDGTATLAPGSTFDTNDNKYITKFILDKAGTYTLNGNEITTTEDNVEVKLYNNDTVEFDVNAGVNYKGGKISGVEGTKIKITNGEVSAVMYKAGTVTLDGQAFELIEDAEDGVTVKKTEEGLFSSHIMTEAEIASIKENSADQVISYFGSLDAIDEYIGKNIEENITISNDDSYTVKLLSNGISEIGGISGGTTISGKITFDGKADDFLAEVILVSTESDGKFNFGSYAYEINDNSVTLQVEFERGNTGNGKVLSISDLDGNFTGKVGNVITINDKKILLEKGSDKFIAMSDGENVTISGLADGESVTFDADKVSVEMTEKTLTVNGVTYELKGDSDGIIIDGDKITGLNPEAKLTISDAGNYTINGTPLEVGAGNVVIGVSEKEAKIYEDINANTSTEKILENLGIEEDKQQTVSGAEYEEVTLPNATHNAAVIDENTSGEKKVTFGDKGSAAVIENTDAIVSLRGGAGKDSVVSKGEDVTFDMVKGGKDRVIATDGKVTLDNYQTGTNAGVKVTTEQLNEGIQFSTGKVKLGTAENAPEVVIGNDTKNFVNIYTPDEEEKRVGFATNGNKVVDASDRTHDMVLIGGGNFDGMSLAEEVTGSSLLSGSGNDTIYGGAGSYIDAGAGKNFVSMSDEGGSTVNFAQGKTSLDNFNFADGTAPADTLQTGELAITDVKVVDGDVILKTNNGRVQINDAEGKTMAFKNDFTTENLNLNVADTDLKVAGNGLYWAAGKDAKVSLSDDYANENGANIDLNNYNFNDKDAISFAGDIKDVDASAFNGKSTITANDKANVITASGDGSTMYGGAGNDTFIGGAGADEFVVGKGKTSISGFSADDTLNAEEAIIQSVTVSGDEVVLKTDNGSVRLAELKGQAMQFTSQYVAPDNDGETNGTISMTIDDTELNVKENGLYWAAGQDATVSLADYSGESAVANLADYNFNNKDALSFNGDIKELDATGYEGNATLSGNTGNNVITGGSGSNELWGGAGGNDTLIGGDGDDTFIYKANNGNDVVQGANENDVVKFDGVSLSDIATLGEAALSANGDIKFTLNDGNSLTIKDGQTSGVTVDIDGTKYAVDKESGEWKYV